MKRSAFMAAAAVALLCCAPAAAEVKVTEVLAGLDNPCGVAIQPGTGHVFVADSAGKRVLRLVDGKPQDVIVDFPQDVYGKGPMYDIGPLGLAFLDAKTLVVGGGGLIDDKELLRIYEVPTAGKPPIKADQMVANFTLPANENLAAEGNYYGVAVTKTGIFVTCNGDDTKGWVARADRQGNQASNFRRFIATKEATEVDAPVAITVGPQDFLVVGQMGEITLPEDSLVTVYDSESGEMKLNLETGLYDITALAFTQGPSPKLYALDFAWMTRDPQTGENELAGLYLLEKAGTPDQPALSPQLIVKLNQPTAMVFADDGTLYVTLGNDQAAPKTGKLVKIQLDK